MVVTGTNRTPSSTLLWVGVKVMHLVRCSLVLVLQVAAFVKTSDLGVFIILHGACYFENNHSVYKAKAERIVTGKIKGSTPLFKRYYAILYKQHFLLWGYFFCHHLHSLHSKHYCANSLQELRREYLCLLLPHFLCIQNSEMAFKHWKGNACYTAYPLLNTCDMVRLFSRGALKFILIGIYDLVFILFISYMASLPYVLQALSNHHNMLNCNQWLPYKLFLSRFCCAVPEMFEFFCIDLQGSVDYTTLGEAHGMISDLLADSNLPPNVASTLKIISTMIALPTAFHVGQRPFVSPMTPLIEKFRDEHQEDKVKDQPDLKDDLPLPMVGVSSLYHRVC